MAWWVELFIEPLSDVWLAAMALHAQSEDNDFAFGYLIAQIDRRHEVEPDFLRGKKSVESGRAGGNAKARLRLPASENILSEMRQLVAKGSTVRGSRGPRAQARQGKVAGGKSSPLEPPPVVSPVVV